MQSDILSSGTLKITYYYAVPQESGVFPLLLWNPEIEYLLHAVDPSELTVFGTQYQKPKEHTNMQKTFYICPMYFAHENCMNFKTIMISKVKILITIFPYIQNFHSSDICMK